ncbi:Biotin biosynthesis cytochrome P450 [Shimia thalassica]|uniref:Biotin biosynthesis cytochrome P450 n=2 Tax=Shimia thalassica TaxID=1715693 RepID=A0A0P1IA70_9RHOB|nr:Biotin biosynthesis cytochrome P450 [Shimia thalassica]
MAVMKSMRQSPTDPAFVQNPYAFYEEARPHGPLVWWKEYGMPAALSQDLVQALFKDRRFGREVPAELAQPHAAHLDPFYTIEAHSMLELEPPRHTRLRSLVLRAFTTRQIQAMRDDIHALCHDLIDAFPKGPFDLIPAYAAPLPVAIICRLLGFPEAMGEQLLLWSNDMVAMYQARRTREIEDRAAQASTEFADFVRSYIDQRRANPSDDLLTQLIAAEEDGEKLSTDELVTTCILLLNAGHEATVHSLGNGVKTLLEHQTPIEAYAPDRIDRTVEEILRYDPPLHMFTRHAYEPVEIAGHQFKRGDQVALLLGAANRDPLAYEDAQSFDTTRAPLKNAAFGGGLHFCVGAPLARLELQIALPILFERCPNLSLAEAPQYANLYHFHGLDRLLVTS